MDAPTALLKELADLRQPPPPSWLPQTQGWAILGALLLLAALWAGWRAWRRYRARRYRREALAALAAFEASLDAGAVERARALAGAAALLKRTALAAWPREQVAALSGEAWGRFLGAHAGSAPEAAGRLAPVVNDIEYQGEAALAALPAQEARAFFGACRQWIAGHRAPA
ncbi:MAG: DUF4381 domain-containing protein [Variovorax sp.]|nr:DUF4381 domain-containing protein [Variovorax sp.]